MDLQGAPVWTRSSLSQAMGEQCVEAALNLPRIVKVRDSKNPDLGVLAVSHRAWRALTRQLSDS